MYINMKKIKDLEINKNWFFIGALFFLTILATVFFSSHNKNNSMITDQSSPVKVQVPATKNPAIKKDVVSSSPVVSEDPDVLMKWPGQGEVITGFGFVYSETFNDVRYHSGIDLALPAGYEVRSALSGTVVSISSSPMWGYEIVIKHGDKLETRYKGIKPLKEEASYQVAKGEIIGQVIKSPKYEAVMSPHLHFEVYEYGKSVDPMKYL